MTRKGQKDKMRNPLILRQARDGQPMNQETVMTTSRIEPQLADNAITILKARDLIGDETPENQPTLFPLDNGLPESRPRRRGRPPKRERVE